MDANEIRSLTNQAQFGRKQGARGAQGMVICSHPVASKVGVDVLRRGGNACDAALAMSVTQTVVEPHMTTITGMLSMLYYDAATGETTYLNGGMNAPLAPLLDFKREDIGTGRGACVPGWWAGFEAALQRHGTKPKSEIMADAIQIAYQGFEVHPFLFAEMFEQCATLGRTPEARAMFMPEGVVLAPGQVLRQIPVGRTLERLRDEGNDYFYKGEFARTFVETVQAHGGVITTDDLEQYQIRWVEPAWSTYHEFALAASPPPDNGGTHVLEALNMYELLDLKSMGPPTESADSLYYMARISDLVKREGDRHTDPFTHQVPLDLILSKDYAGVRMELLMMDAPMDDHQRMSVSAGSNHVSVVDARGNVATILHSCMSTPWSNGLFCEGVSICAGAAHFLRIMPRPGERATVYVAPTIVFKDGKPVLPCGSPSAGLVSNILQNIINLLDFGLPIDESVHRPRFGNSFQASGVMIEVDVGENLRKDAEKRGIRWEVVNPWNWNHGAFEGIWIDPETGEASACADPRRAGMALAV